MSKVAARRRPLPVGPRPMTPSSNRAEPTAACTRRATSVASASGLPGMTPQNASAPQRASQSDGLIDSPTTASRRCSTVSPWASPWLRLIAPTSSRSMNTMDSGIPCRWACSRSRSIRSLKCRRLYTPVSASRSAVCRLRWARRRPKFFSNCDIHRPYGAACLALVVQVGPSPNHPASTCCSGLAACSLHGKRSATMRSPGRWPGCVTSPAGRCHADQPSVIGRRIVTTTSVTTVSGTTKPSITPENRGSA